MLTNFRYSICFVCSEWWINRTISKGASKGRERTLNHSFGSLMSSLVYSGVSTCPKSKTLLVRPCEVNDKCENSRAENAIGED